MAGERITTFEPVSGLPNSIRVITLNCWGLKYVAKHRHARLTEIGHQLAIASPQPDIVGLQECWTQQDYLKIRQLTNHILPHGKFYWSGAIGSGLAILSKWPIEESSMFPFPLNGKPAAVIKGDWYVGKGVACARIRIGPAPKDAVEVFCSHFYAPHERDPSLLNHRTAQAWEIAKLMRHAAERGHMVLGLGDFNSAPLGLAYRILEAHSPARDIWRVVKPNSAAGAAQGAAMKAGAGPPPSAKDCLEEHGATSDSKFNTWRWQKGLQKDLDKGKDIVVPPDTPDPRAKRLDYIFFYDNGTDTRWTIEKVEVGMTMRHPTKKCSLSDHFSVEATLTRHPGVSGQTPSPMISPLPAETYDGILDMISRSEAREHRQRRFQLAHFFSSVAISIACFIAVWWSPHNYVSFILLLVSTVGFGAGILNGLMGFLFIGSELRALREFQHDIRNARDQAKHLLQAPS